MISWLRGLIPATALMSFGKTLNFLQTEHSLKDQVSLMGAGSEGIPCIAVSISKTVALASRAGVVLERFLIAPCEVRYVRV